MQKQSSSDYFTVNDCLAAFVAGLQSKQLHISPTAGWREEGGERVDWLDSTLDGWCCCWKVIPHSETEGEGDLGEIMKWKEQVYSKQRERGETEERVRPSILSVFILKLVFFFFPQQVPWVPLHPLFSVTALKGPMFILKDIRRHVLTHTHTHACDSFGVQYSAWAEKLHSFFRWNQEFLVQKSSVWNVSVSSLELNIITVFWTETLAVQDPRSRSP